MKFTEYWAYLEEILPTLQREDKIKYLTDIQLELETNFPDLLSAILQEGTSEQLMTYISWLMQLDVHSRLADFRHGFGHHSDFIRLERRSIYFTSLCKDLREKSEQEKERASVIYEEVRNAILFEILLPAFREHYKPDNEIIEYYPIEVISCYAKERRLFYKENLPVDLANTLKRKSDQHISDAQRKMVRDIEAYFDPALELKTEEFISVWPVDCVVYLNFHYALIMDGHEYRPKGLIFEYDGPHHDLPEQKVKDKLRDAFLEQQGYVVYRSNKNLPIKAILDSIDLRAITQSEKNGSGSSSGQLIDDEIQKRQVVEKLDQEVMIKEKRDKLLATTKKVRAKEKDTPADELIKDYKNLLEHEVSELEPHLLALNLLSYVIACDKAGKELVLQEKRRLLAKAYTATFKPATQANYPLPATLDQVRQFAFKELTAVRKKLADKQKEIADASHNPSALLDRMLTRYNESFCREWQNEPETNREQLLHFTAELATKNPVDKKIRRELSEEIRTVIKNLCANPNTEFRYLTSFEQWMNSYYLPNLLMSPDQFAEKLGEFSKKPETILHYIYGHYTEESYFFSDAFFIDVHRNKPTVMMSILANYLDVQIELNLSDAAYEIAYENRGLSKRLVCTYDTTRSRFTQLNLIITPQSISFSSGSESTRSSSSDTSPRAEHQEEMTLSSPEASLLFDKLFSEEEKDQLGEAVEDYQHLFSKVVRGFALRYQQETEQLQKGFEECIKRLSELTESVAAAKKNLEELSTRSENKKNNPSIKLEPGFKAKLERTRARYIEQLGLLSEKENQYKDLSEKLQARISLSDVFKQEALQIQLKAELKEAYCLEQNKKQQEERQILEKNLKKQERNRERAQERELMQKAREEKAAGEEEAAKRRTQSINVVKLHGAINNEDNEQILSLLDEDPELATLALLSGLPEFLPVHHAISKGNLAAVKSLLTKSPECATKTLDEGKTILYVAAQFQHRDIVELILQMCSEHQLAKKAEESGRGFLPAHQMASEGNLQILKLLLDDYRSAVTIPDFMGRMLLHLAVWYKHQEIVEFLLERFPEAELAKIQTLGFFGSEDIFSKHASVIRDWGPRCSELPVHIAARQGHLDIMKRLLEAYPDSIEMKDGDGLTILHLAVFNNRVEIVRYLVDHHPNLLNIKTADKISLLPLELAEFTTRNIPIIKILQGAMTKVSKISNFSSGSAFFDKNFAALDKHSGPPSPSS